MKEIAEELIQKYFSDLITHHKSIFGLHKDATLKENNFIAIHEEIFAFINLIRQIDESFEDKILDSCLDDIIHLIQFINKLSKENDLSKQFIHEVFIKLHDLSCNQDQVYALFKREFKLSKNSLVALLNSKLFYLDKYIWYKINQSHELRQLLKIKKLSHINSTHEYLKHSQLKKSNIHLDYSSFKVQFDHPLKAQEIEFIKLLANKQSKKGNDATEQLIRYKKHIPYFKNISCQDIRDIVKEVKFLHYKEHEVLIKELDNSNEIFFLVDGECRVSLQQRTLGTIQKETIFGEFSFITKQPRSATVKTNRNSIIISFHFDLDSFENNPCLFSQLYKNISEELVKKIYIMNKEHISV